MKNNATIVRAMIALGLGLAVPTARAEIELAEGLKANGFIDMSTTYADKDGEDSKTISFDQWEIDLMFDAVENVSARVDINDVNASDEGVVVEQAFVTYDFGNGLTATAGKFLSALGYEGAEPTLLYQYSVSATIIGYPGYANGVSLDYGCDMGSLHAAVVDGFYTADNDGENLSYEVQAKLTPVEGLTLQAGYATEKIEIADEVDPVTLAIITPGDEYDKGIANFWAEYKVGSLTLAGEYNLLYDIEGSGSDGDGYLVMGNYSFGKLGLTLRHSNADLDNGYEDTEFTVSPNYALTSNLLLVSEYRHDDYGDAGDADTFALEAIFTF